jgi:hypothetical protein
MPPITDPALLEEIKRQQRIQAAPMSPAVPNPMIGQPMINPFRTQQMQDATARLGISREEVGLSAGNRADDHQLQPARLSKANADAAKAELEYKALQEKWDLAHPKAAAGIDPNAVGEQAISDLNEADRNIVKGIVQGRVPVSSLALSRNPHLFELTQRAFQYEPGTDLTTFQRRQAAANKFLANPNSPMVRVNQALQHLDRYYTNALALDNFKSSVLTNPLNVDNYARNAYRSVSKDPKFVAAETDRDALATELAAAFAGSGQGGALADREEWKKRLSLAGSPEALASQVREAVSLLSGRVEASNAQFKQATGANADFFDLMSPKARQVYEKFSDPNFAASSTDTGEKKLSTDTKTIAIPQGYQNEHTAFLHDNLDHLTPEQYVQFRNQMDDKYLTVGHQPISLEDAKNYLDALKKGSKSAPIPGIQTGMTDIEKQRAAFAMSPLGTGLENFANAGTLGAVDLAVGQEGREVKDLANAENPKAAFAGEIAGSIGGLSAVEKVSAKLAAKLGVSPTVMAKLLGGTGRADIAADVGTNAAYGGARGFAGADEGQGGSGFAQGLAAGGLAGGAGQLVTKGVAPVLNQATSDALKQLKNVDMTTLQRLGLGGVEESIHGLPFVRGARADAVKSFNRDNANRALSYIGVKVPKDIPPGTAMNNFVDQQASNFYNTVKPKIVGKVDKTFNDAVIAMKAGANTADKKAMFQEIQDALLLFKDPKTGAYTGDGYRAASERLRALTDAFSTRAENQGDIAAQDMARVAEQARKQMQFVVGRNTPEVAADLKAVERTWARKMRIEDASNRAQQNDSVYSPGQYGLSIKKLDTSRNKGATARGQALDQSYQEASQKIIGADAVPKKISLRESGIAAAALGGGAYAAPAAATFFAGAAFGAYGPGVKRIVQYALTGKRPTAIDNAIVRKAFDDFMRHGMTGD